MVINRQETFEQSPSNCPARVAPKKSVEWPSTLSYNAKRLSHAIVTVCIGLGGVEKSRSTSPSTKTECKMILSREQLFHSRKTRHPQMSASLIRETTYLVEQKACETFGLEV